MALTVILPQNEYSRALGDTLAPLLPPDVSWRDPAEGLEGLAGARLLFAVALDEGGCNMGCWGLLSLLRRSAGLLAGCLGAVVVTGRGELYTKDVARDVVLAANLAGCAFWAALWWRPPVPSGISGCRPRSRARTSPPRSVWLWRN